ncbi:Respiratory nitrate reductase alpha chain [Salmonella enterica subsp. enterica serovar Montevideo str. S5-403]|uniref:Respiratory nitrate reductase alpha chain n=1 Tax=Salmonella enterica subsp. enterica serovar Montevideo str. S5-403 TaxID=913242 RepID=G5Q217_SALMO|nr:Respiratory nitrate reductase alpha chain [Salmonella enterica subsp. enterica serovar Montevideo str. S5-403]
MHPFIHPLSAAVDPAWESKSDWEIYKGIAKKFSEVCVGHLGKETDVVTLPIQHDSAAELAQPLDVKDWKKGECDLIPGKTAPHIMTVERDYPATYERFTSIGPLMEKIGNGGKGIAWNTQSEMDLLRKLNYTKTCCVSSITIRIWQPIKKKRKSASAIFRPSRAKLSPARPGLVWKMSTFLITPVIPTFTS